MSASVTHKAKAGALLTGAEYEAADAHDVSITAADVGAEDAGAVAAHEAASDPHTGYRKESDDHTHASSGAQGGTVAHSALTGVTANQHHNQAHALNSADHTGAFTSVPVGTVTVYTGSGDPESSQTAEAGSLYLRTSGLLYVKASGSGNTGWKELLQAD